MNSKKKKNNKMKLNNKGFTLIELLVVITLISLVFSISAYFISGAIRKAKEKTYLTTINEIEKAAGNYLLENSDKLYFIKSGDIEYQCVIVKDLIDYGFLNEDVTESKVNDDNTVGKNNYIYIERNTSTKAVEKNVYITELDSSYGNICTASVNASGGIYFDYETGWSKQKDVNITYELKNASNINNYKFGYKYTLQNGTILHNYSNDSEMHKTISNLDKAGSVYADIIYDNDTSNKVSESTKSITKFDNTGPTISVEPHEYRYFSKKIVVSLFVNDCTNEGRNCSGVKSDYTSSELEAIKNNKIVVKVGNNTISNNNIALTKISTNVYKLEINNSEYDGEVSIRVLENAFVDKVVDEEKNGNVETLLNPYFKFDNTAPNIDFVMLDASDDSEVATSNYSFSSSNSLSWFKFTPKLKFIGNDSGSGLDNNVISCWNEWGKTTLNTNLTCSNQSGAWTGDPPTWDSNNVFVTKITANGYRYVKLHACDKANNCTDKKVYFKFDNTAPTTEVYLLNGTISVDSSYFTSSSDTISNISKWVTFTPKLKFTGSDSLSGLSTSAKLYWNDENKTSFSDSNKTIVNNGYSYNWNNSNGTKTITTGEISANGYRYLYLDVCDAIGNCTEQEVYFKFDNTAPTNPVITNNYNSTNWYNRAKYDAGVEYKLNASTSESLSGVNNWQYTYNPNATETSTNAADQNDKWITYAHCSSSLTCQTSPFSAERNGTSVYIRVCDKAGNCSTKSSTKIYLDITPPTAPNITNNYNSSNWYNKAKYDAGVKYELNTSTSESLSGVNNWQYTYNPNATETGSNSSEQDNKWITYAHCSSSLTCQTSPFSAERNGTSVYIRVCDKAGNCSTKSSTKIYLDITSPTISFKMYNGQTKIDQIYDGNKYRYYLYNSKASSDPGAEWLDFFPKLEFTASDSISKIDVDNHDFGYNNMSMDNLLNSIPSANHSKLSNITSFGNDYSFAYTLNGYGRRYFTFKVCDNAGNCMTKHLYLNVNQTVNATKYDCDYYANNDDSGDFRLRILNVTQCGTNCTYNKLNGLGSVYNLDMDVNAPISWSIGKNQISDEIDEACSSQYYIKNNDTLNCYKGVNIYSGEVTTVSSNCSLLKVYRTTMKEDNSGNNWYYIKEKNCYIQGSKLTDTEPSECNPASNSYSVTFDANGGYFSDYSTSKYVLYSDYGYNDILWLSNITRPTRSGCSFAYWTFNGASRSRYIDEEENGGTLKANWSCGGGSSSGGSSSGNNIPCYAKTRKACSANADLSKYCVGWERFTPIEAERFSMPGKCLWRGRDENGNCVGSWNSCV